MRRLVLFICLFIFLISPVSAKIITGGVEVSVEQAREDVFTDLRFNNEYNIEQEYIVDKNCGENISLLLKGTTELKDRTLALFSDGTYGVIYKNNPINVYYYSRKGILNYKEIKSSLVYPYKTYKYSVVGELTNVSLRISDEEAYIFNAEGDLIAHWVGNYCYNEAGDIIMQRKIFK